MRPSSEFAVLVTLAPVCTFVTESSCNALGLTGLKLDNRRAPGLLALCSRVATSWRMRRYTSPMYVCLFGGCGRKAKGVGVGVCMQGYPMVRQSLRRMAFLGPKQAGMMLCTGLGV
ncbi:hypothetical protein SODALDRAFT_328687 [Sodiomyces alkalinus F11]|uniref:Secreted protein n=1 Tax=Sodiomyces alkalinus (strain CBS 110278 / VKM F-3762 / F11) TaxID=1314773 RepID=A0A3N2PLG2_SODAK|nr:hypothetical protein SODALDRAFT_328687 [Sodiomyces alkalinus F11]ROT35358.1 hypothetical protein SODALDRAFT_328687 [Sodiomyces alkalinus F11]